MSSKRQVSAIWLILLGFALLCGGCSQAVSTAPTSPSDSAEGALPVSVISDSNYNDEMSGQAGNLFMYQGFMVYDDDYTYFAVCPTDGSGKSNIVKRDNATLKSEIIYAGNGGIFNLRMKNGALYFVENLEGIFSTKSTYPDTTYYSFLVKYDLDKDEVTCLYHTGYLDTINCFELYGDDIYLDSTENVGGIYYINKDGEITELDLGPNYQASQTLFLYNNKLYYGNEKRYHGYQTLYVYDLSTKEVHIFAEDCIQVNMVNGILYVEEPEFNLKMKQEFQISRVDFGTCRDFNADKKVIFTSSSIDDIDFNTWFTFSVINNDIYIGPEYPHVIYKVLDDGKLSQSFEIGSSPRNFIISGQGECFYIGYYYPEHPFFATEGFTQNGGIAEYLGVSDFDLSDAVPSVAPAYIWTEVLENEQKFLTETLSAVNSLESVNIEYIPEAVNISVDVDTTYAPTEIATIFNQIASQSVSDYVYNWTDCQGHKSIPYIDYTNFNDWVGIDRKNVTQIIQLPLAINIIISESGGKTLYSFQQTIFSDLAGPGWISLENPAGKSLFAFLYAAPQALTNQMTTLEPQILNGINAFSPQDVLDFKDQFGVTIGDDLESALQRYQPEDVEAYFDYFFSDKANLYYYFDFGAMSFQAESYTVSGINIDKAGLISPRGTVIGDNYADVLSKFPIGERYFAYENQYQEIVYFIGDANSTWWFEGAINYNEDMAVESILYSFFSRDTGYGLQYDIVNDLVVSIRLFTSEGLVH